MKVKIFLAITTFMLTLFLSLPTNAYTNCRWVPGYWANGYFHHAHKVCWNKHKNKNCYWRHGIRYCDRVY